MQKELLSSRIVPETLELLRGGVVAKIMPFRGENKR